MRIALFHTTLPERGRKVGGVEVAVHRLANALSETGKDEVTVFSLSPIPPDAMYRHVQLFSKMPYLLEKRALRLFILPLALNFVDFDGYDVIHLHGDDWFFFNRGTPSVRTFHGSALFEARNATSFKRRIAQHIIYPLEHLAAHLASTKMAVGPETADIYSAPYIVDNGVNIDIFHPGSKTECPSVLFVGTWEGRKRGKFLYDVFTGYVLDNVPDATLYMVTDTCQVHERVVHVSFPDDDLLADLYRRAWVFAYPSTYEGFGIPYVEAMASGTAILTSPNPGAGYVLDDGYFGMLVNDEDFGKQLVEILAKPELRAVFQRKGLERAASFLWSNVAASHRLIYQDVVSRAH